MSNLEKHLMTAKQSKVFADEYTKSNYAAINKNRPADKPDSKKYSIELGVLKEYLQLLEDEMDKKGISSKGIQVCLGKYPEDTKDPKLKSEYLGYQMIFFAPIDLKPERSNGLARVEEEEAAPELGGIPVLNYMNITPPY